MPSALYNVLSDTINGTRSTLGTMLILSWGGYLGGYALDKPALASTALRGVLFFGAIWLLYVLVSFGRNVASLTKSRY